MSLSIRPAQPADTAIILDLIKGLADYEKLLHEVEATQANIAASLFCPNPRVFCDIAQWHGEPAGFALWYYNYSTFLGRHGIHLEDLFVKPGFRTHGIGKAMLVRLARRCLGEKLGRLEWSVLDWNEPAISFYRKHGAVLLDGWTGCRLSGVALRALARDDVLAG
jgi:diamine N-acetyltransferase